MAPDEHRAHPDRLDQQTRYRLQNESPDQSIAPPSYSSHAGGSAWRPAAPASGSRWPTSHARARTIGREAHRRAGPGDQRGQGRAAGENHRGASPPGMTSASTASSSSRRRTVIGSGPAFAQRSQVLRVSPCSASTPTRGTLSRSAPTDRVTAPVAGQPLLYRRDHLPDRVKISPRVSARPPLADGATGRTAATRRRGRSHEHIAWSSDATCSWSRTSARWLTLPIPAWHGFAHVGSAQMCNTGSGNGSRWRSHTCCWEARPAKAAGAPEARCTRHSSNCRNPASSKNLDRVQLTGPSGGGALA